MAEKKKAKSSAEAKADGAKKKTTKDGNTVTKKRTKKPGEVKDTTVTADFSEQDLFALVPDEDEAARLTPIDEIGEAELARIEAEAIAALPRAEVEPELLMYDPEEIEDTHESPEEAARYEDYLRDYKEIMAELLKAAKESSEFSVEDDATPDDDDADDDEDIDDISEYVVTEDVTEPEDEEELISEDCLTSISAASSLADENSAEMANISAEAIADKTEPLAETADSDEVEAIADEVEPLAEAAGSDEVEAIADEAEPSAEAADSDETEATADKAEPLAEAADSDEVEATADEADLTESEAESTTPEANSLDENGEPEELPIEEGFVEISKNRFDEDFDPLSTISLTEYVSSLRGEEESEQLNLFEDGEETDDEQFEEPEYDDESEELYEELGEAEQLEMHFGGEDDEESERVDRNKYDPEHPRRIDRVFDLVEMLIFTFAAIIILTSFFFRHSVIDGSSMENTLHDRDVVIISDFLYTPKRGDIVVLDDRSAHDGAIVKRVIGIEGDRVTIERNGDVYVNGKKLTEKYIYEDLPHSYKENTWYVGKGEIFVLGDHRNVSDDSEDFGPVSVDSVLGKVLFRVWPFEVFGQVK
ncbi:MAG: signal peptidase I [Clostridia bacterium]|nr:signal peptidase I [Clostridia bacterium]